MSKEIKEEIDATSDLGDLVNAYEEIAVMRIHKIRQTVESTRDYSTELKFVMNDVKSSFQRDSQKNNKTKPTELPLAVLVSSDSGLSGQLVYDIFNNFFNFVSSHECNILIVGRLGKDLFSGAMPTKKFEYIELPDKIAVHEELKRIAEKIIPHGSVRLFHGRMVNLLKQTTEEEVFGAIDDNERKETPDKQVVSFIFEPDIEQITQFFNTEIAVSILSHAIKESQLAVWGSRVKAMEETSSKIEKRLRSLHIAEQLDYQDTKNRKQRQTMAGRMLWEIEN